MLTTIFEKKLMFNQDELAFISLFLFCSMPKHSSFLLAVLKDPSESDKLK